MHLFWNDQFRSFAQHLLSQPPFPENIFVKHKTVPYIYIASVFHVINSLLNNQNITNVRTHVPSSFPFHAVYNNVTCSIQLSGQAPFTSEVVGSVLSTHLCEKSQRSAFCQGFS